MSNDTPNAEERLLRQLMYTIGAVVIVFFLTVSSCSMHSNAYEPDVEAEYTKQIQAKAVAEQHRIKALKELIDSGVNPVAARCAIQGWSGSTAGNLCERASEKEKK